MHRRNSNRAGWLTCLLAAGILPSSGVHAAVSLVLDINQTPGSAAGTTGDSNPSDFVDFDGHLIFVADDGIHGRELWQSDGTAAGTKLIVDLAPGAASSTPNNLVVANGLLYFFASDGAGVSHLMALAPGSTTPISLAPLSASCTSGTRNALPVMGGKLFLSATDGTGSQIWVTDGTPAGTTRFDLPVNASIPSTCDLAVFDGTLYVEGPSLDFHQQAIRATSGTWADVRQLTELPFDEQFTGFITNFNGAIYFNSWIPGPPQEVTSYGIYRAVETQLGAPPESVLGGGTNDSVGDIPRMLGISNGRLVAEKITKQPPKEITVALGFSSDGVGFTWLPDQVLGPTLISGGLTFATVSKSPGTVGALLNPWVTDGTTGGSHQLATIGQSGATAINWFADYQGTTLFSVNDPTQGQQLWRSDGTSAKTAFVANVSAPPTLPTVVGSNFFMVIQDPTAGKELYVFTGGPVAVDVTGTSSGDAPVQLAVLSASYDNGGSLDKSSVKVVSPPSHGTATAGMDGTITYTPNTGYSGSDSFTYTVADTAGTPSTPAKVSVTVTAPAPSPPKSGGGGAMQIGDLLALFAALSLIGFRGFGRHRSCRSHRILIQ